MELETIERESIRPEGVRLGSSIPDGDRDALIDRVMRLPAWLDHQLGTDNLDVKKLEMHELWRLRSGAFRVVFQKLEPHVVVHRVFRKKNGSDYDAMASIVFVRSAEGLRALVEEIDESRPVPETRRPIVRTAQREVVQNPLSPFTDAELAAVGLTADSIERLRTLPPQLLPDGESHVTALSRSCGALSPSSGNVQATTSGRSFIPSARR